MTFLDIFAKLQYVLSPNGSNTACRFQHVRGSLQPGHKPGSRNEDVVLQFPRNAPKTHNHYCKE